MIPGPLKQAIKSSLQSASCALIDLKKNNDLKVFLPGHVKSLLEHLKINCVIDVGANVGDYGAMLRSYGYRGRIVSLEPLAEPYRELEARAKNDHEWLTMNIACGSKDEPATMNVFNTVAFSSLLPPSDAMSSDYSNDVQVKGVETVTVRRLDSVFAELIDGLAEPRVFLKIDTQGFDFEVAKGAGACMDQVLALQSELSVVTLYQNVPSYLEVLQFYRHLGFEPTGFFPIINSPQTRNLIEFDAVLIRCGPQNGNHNLAAA